MGVGWEKGMSFCHLNRYPHPTPYIQPVQIPSGWGGVFCTDAGAPGPDTHPLTPLTPRGQRTLLKGCQVLSLLLPIRRAPSQGVRWRQRGSASIHPIHLPDRCSRLLSAHAAASSRRAAEHHCHPLPFTRPGPGAWQRTFVDRPPPSSCPPTTLETEAALPYLPAGPGNVHGPERPPRPL